MRDFFSIDGKVYGVLNIVSELLELNLLFLIFCLPFFTVGASLSALYSVVFQIREERSIPVISRFFSAWKLNLKQGTEIWLIQLGAMFVLIVGYWAISFSVHGSVIVLLPIYVLIAILLLGCCYCYPLAARYTMSLSQILWNSLALGVSNVWQSAVMAIIAIVCIVCVPIFQLRLLFLWFLFGFSVTGYLQTWLLNMVFRRYSQQDY